MNEKQLERRVDEIIALRADDEAAHTKEDSLHLAVIEEYCPAWVRREIKRLSDVDFSRWCA